MIHSNISQMIDLFDDTKIWLYFDISKPYNIAFITLRFRHQNSHTYGSKLWHLGGVNHRLMNAKAYRCHNRSKAYK